MSDWRIGIGRFWHESNGFSSLPTTIDDFLSCEGTAVGPDILNHPERRDEVTGFVDVLGRDARVELAPLLAVGAMPSGLVAQEAVRTLEETLRTQLRHAGRLDGICFALHGAMSAVTIPDLDGYFLQVVREEVGPDIPIVCSLDCHAVVTRRMVDLATALIAYRTHPHVDIVETGARAARILLDVLQGTAKPVAWYQRVPLLLPPSDDGTNSGPLKELFDTFIAWDNMEGVIACSLCFSFAWQDVPEQGWAALAVTNGDEALAERLARELAGLCWDARKSLLPEPMLPPEAAVREAQAAPGRPVIITDSADALGAGGGGDNTVILETLLRMRGEVDGLILLHIPDPHAVSALKASKVGEMVTVTVGGRRDSRFSKPVPVTGRILCITNGPIDDDGKFGSEPVIEVGSIVCLGVDNLRLVLTERVILGPQPSVFRKVGIEPFDAKIVALKTGVGFKVTYGRVAKAVIRADCPGAASYNLSNYDFTHIPRPMFPVDGDFDWKTGLQTHIHQEGARQ